MLTKLVNTASQFIDPESIHKLAMQGLKFYPTQKVVAHATPLGWNNKIALAAGFDKNGEYIDTLARLGFGAIEIGSVTPLPQAGNPRPRIEKLTSSRSIRNWMGFPSLGVAKVKKNLLKTKSVIPIGINIGKNLSTPNSRACDDYLHVALELKEFASYFVINISSPNTKNLRDLQNTDFLNKIFSAFKENHLKIPFIKISPDLSQKELKKIIDCIKQNQGPGIIATNTTNQHSFKQGGISGELLKDLSFETVRYIQSLNTENLFDVIACGGINSIEDIKRYEKLNIKHFQIYSALVYQGPKVIGDLLRN